MNKLIFTAIFITLALSSGTILGQVTSVGCNIDTIKYSSAIGYQTTALGWYSLAAGYRTNTDKDNSFVFGTGYSNRLFTSPSPNSFLIGFERKPVFFAQLNDASLHRVGIGTVAPKATLDVTGMTRTETLRMVNHSFLYNTEKNMGFYPVAGDEPHSMPQIPTLFLSENNVGIKTGTPTATLDVNGNVRADTVKIKRSIFMPEKELSFTYYSNGKPPIQDSITTPQTVVGDSASVSGSIPGIENPGIKKLITLKYVNDFGGRLGIGTDNPQSSLHVNGTARVSGWGRFETGLKVGSNQILSGIKLQVEGNSYFQGEVGIGTTNTFGYTLAVNGNIGCKEVKVEVSNNWPDYVFAPEYNLKTLQELDSYVKEHQHLPEVPSAGQVMEEGIGLSEMNALLLKKIEELTLYIIQQNARIEALEQVR